MSLEFYTVACKEIFKNYLKYWGSIVGGVLLSLEFYTVAIPFIKKKKEICSISRPSLHFFF
jgi:hypothetical protein